MTFQAPSRSAMIWALQELELEGHSENLIGLHPHPRCLQDEKIRTLDTH